MAVCASFNAALGAEVGGIFGADSGIVFHPIFVHADIFPQRFTDS